MKRTFLWLACIFCFISLNKLNAQSTAETVDIDVSETYAERIGKTLPLRMLIPMVPTDEYKKEIAEGNKEAPNNFAGRGKYEQFNMNAMPQGPDPIRQKSISPDKLFPVEPLVNVEGISTSSAPNDPSGDVGADHFLMAVNATSIAAYDKDGVLVAAPFSANTIWNSIGFSSAGDPIIMYDQVENRWIITEFPSGNQLLFAISDDSDPLGSYTAYNFGTPNFPDYPKYGIWSNAYSVTTNEQGPSQLPTYFINRQQILDGDAVVQIQRITIPGFGSGPGFQVATPVDWTGMTPPAEDKPLIVSLADDAWSASNDDQVRVHEFDIDFDNVANTTLVTTSIITADYDSNPCSVAGPGFSCIPQGGNGGGLDGLPEVIMNQVHYRNFGSYEVMVMNFITDIGGNTSGIRWVELRRSGGDWELYQEGTWGPDDGLDRYMGASCIDGNGNIGLVYNVSSEDTFVGIRFTGRLASDPLGEMTVDEYNVVDGENTINSFGRFGDYVHMSIDPTNDRTFWYVGNYAGGGYVDNRIVAFEFQGDTTDIGPSALTMPQSADDLTATETVQVDITNFGLETQTTFEVGYTFEGGPADIDVVNVTLDPDDTYTHTFSTTVDMSVVGDYDFVVFNNLLGDGIPFNDTLRVTRSKLPRWDAGIANITGLEGIVCGDPVPAQMLLTNYGTETLTEVDITVTLNAAPLTMFNWNGSLAQGESELINFDVTGFVGGVNEVVATTSSPNGMTDEIMLNDGFTREFDGIENAVTVFLNILTDNYSGETTWELEDDNGVIYSGGPYASNGTLFTEEWCLDPDACYTFTIFDSYGDGICCDWGIGNYNITDEDGGVLVESTGEFGYFETTDFCAMFECMLTSDVDITPESEAGASDGALMITPLNGSAPYQYSIDGGNTFQGSNTFTGLPAGDYDIVILDGNDCTTEATVTVPECALSIMVTTTSASALGVNDGTISIMVSGANNPVQYSIDGGATFQSSPDFGGLMGDEYDVVVLDGIGCTTEMEVIVDVIISSVNTVTYGYIVEMFPNPTDGVFRINVDGLNTSSLWLPLEIYTTDGKLVQSTRLVKYDQNFTGLVSLEQYPDGVYLVRFLDKNIDRMLRVIKQ